MNGNDKNPEVTDPGPSALREVHQTKPGPIGDWTSGSKSAANDNRAPDQVKWRGLLAHHLKYLEESGLTEHTCQKLNIYSTQDPTEIARVLNWYDEHAISRATKLGPCIVFPYPGMVGFAKLRPDSPRKIGPAPDKKLYNDACGHDYMHQDPVDERKTIKYESPRELGTHVYAPEALCPALRDAGEMLRITEGEKKAALACQEGVPTISIPGVTAAHDVEARLNAEDWGGEEFVVHPEIARYAIPGRECCILFDAPDMENNANVIRAAVRLARMLMDQGAVALVGYGSSRHGASSRSNSATKAGSFGSRACRFRASRKPVTRPVTRE